MTTKKQWPRVPFVTVVRLNTDRVADPAAAGLERYVGIEHITPGDLRVRSWGLVAEGTTFTNRFRPGQVLFPKRRAYQRKVAVADFEGVCSGDIYVLESKDPAVLLPELLPFICQTDGFFDHAIGTSAGSLSPRTNWSHLAAYEFPLPPIDEQRRIAEMLQLARSSCETLMEALGSLRRLRRSAIDALCRGTGRTLVRLGDVCSMQNGRAFPGTHYQETGVRLLRPGNMGVAGYLDWDPVKTVHLPESYNVEATDYLVEPGDVLINLTAQSLEDGFMGRVCLARENDSSLLNQRIGRFVLDSNEVCPAYIFRVLQTSRFQQRVISMCEGTKVKHIYWRHIEGFDFVLPSIDAQRDVIKLLAEIDESINSLTNRWIRQCHLRSTISNEWHSRLPGLTSS